jgi:predicted component of type VI protein secretion system
VEDDVAGGGRQEIETLTLNAWLTVRDDDRHNIEYLPVLRVSPSSLETDGGPPVPREKTDFIPPIMFLEGSRSLQSRVRSLIGSITEARREILRDLKRYEAADGVAPKSVAALLRLGHLNAAFGTLSTMVETPGVTPLALYLTLRDTLGRLAAIHCHGAKDDFADDPARDPFAAPAYRHDDPNLWVFELFRKFNRKLLVGDLTPKFREFPFAAQDRKFAAALDDKVFKEGKDFFVGVRNPDVDPESYAKVVQDRNLFKVVPDAERNSVGGFGVTLRRVDDPSGDLPTDAGWVFFRVEKEADERRWRTIVSDPARKVWIFPPTNAPFLERAQYSFFALI